MPTVLQSASPNMGTDPELFIVSKTGRPRAGKRYVKATRDTKGAQIIYDNIAIELRPNPSTCIAHVQDYTAVLVNEVHNKIKRAKVAHGISLTPALKVAKAELAMGGMEFGCSPAYNLSPYGEAHVTTPRVSPKETQVRSIGYHIHMGAEPPMTEVNRERVQAEIQEAYGYIPEYKKAITPRPKPGSYVPPSFILHDPIYRVPLIFMLDTFVGTFGIMMESYLGMRDQADQRRNLIGYGRASEFRTPNHGTEYRTLSSWPMMHPLLVHAAHYLSRDCLVAVANHMQKYVLEMCPPDETADAINAGDVEGCEDIFKRAIKAYEYGVYKASGGTDIQIRVGSFLDGITPYVWLAAINTIDHRDAILQYGVDGSRRSVHKPNDPWIRRNQISPAEIKARIWNPDRIDNFFKRWDFSSHDIGCQSWAVAAKCKFNKPNLSKAATDIQKQVRAIKVPKAWDKE